MHVPVCHKLVHQHGEQTDQQHGHVHVEEQRKNDGNAQLHAHERMNQGLFQARGCLNVRGAMTGPVDQARDAPQGQQPEQDQINQKFFRFH